MINKDVQKHDFVNISNIARTQYWILFLNKKVSIVSRYLHCAEVSLYITLLHGLES